MKLSFDACMFAVLLVLCTPGLVMSGMAAEPSADPQGDHARELHKELAGTRGSPGPEVCAPRLKASKK